MKLSQPREAMPLRVWIALAVLAFGSVAYLAGILLFDDFSLCLARKNERATFSSRPGHTRMAYSSWSNSWQSLARCSANRKSNSGKCGRRAVLPGSYRQQVRAFRRHQF